MFPKIDILNNAAAVASGSVASCSSLRPIMKSRIIRLECRTCGSGVRRVQRSETGASGVAVDTVSVRQLLILQLATRSASFH